MRDKHLVFLREYIIFMKSNPSEKALEVFFDNNEKRIDAFIQNNLAGSRNLAKVFWGKISPKKWFKKHHDRSKKSWLASFLLDHYAGTEAHERGHQIVEDKLIGDSGLVVNYGSEVVTPGTELFDFTSGIVRGEQVNLESLSQLLFPPGVAPPYRGHMDPSYDPASNELPQHNPKGSGDVYNSAFKERYNQLMQETFDESELYTDKNGYVGINSSTQDDSEKQDLITKEAASYARSEQFAYQQKVAEEMAEYDRELDAQSSIIQERERWVTLAGPLASLIYVMILWAVSKKIKRYEVGLKRAALFQHMRMAFYAFGLFDPRVTGDFKVISGLVQDQFGVNPLVAVGSLMGFYAITMAALLKSFMKIGKGGQIVATEKEAQSMFGLPKNIVEALENQFTEELFKEVIEERFELKKITIEKLNKMYGHFTSIYSVLIGDISEGDEKSVKNNSRALIELLRRVRNDIRKNFFRREKITVKGEELIAIQAIRKFLNIEMFPRYKNVKEMLTHTVKEKYKDKKEEDVFDLLYRDKYSIQRLLFLMAASLPRTKRIVKDINVFLHEEKGYISAETFFYISCVVFYLRRSSEGIEQVGQRGDVLKRLLSRK